MKILLIGKVGQVGYELQRTLAPMGELLALDQPDINFLDPEALRKLIRLRSPNVIVNAAAYTAVDRAESDKALCYAINADGPALLAEEARSLGALMVHYSTDYVYPGNKNTPYVETDQPGPLGEYGRSKLEGDQRIASSGANYLIFRTAWVYGARGQNYLRTMLRLAKERAELRIVSDQVGAPTWSRMIAQGTAQAISRSLDDPSRFSGVYHLTAGDQTTWFGFTEAIFDILRTDPRPKLTAITTSEYPTPARRPSYSVLSNEKFAQTFGSRLPDWRQQLALVAADISESAAAAI